MCKILVIGDPHFKKDNSLETGQLYSEIENLYKSTTIDYTVVLGDVLDSFGEIKMIPQCQSIAFLEMCLKYSKWLFVIVGNHDRINQVDFLSDISSLRAIKNLWPRTTLVDFPTSFELEEGKKILLVPYVYPGRFLEALEKASLKIEDHSLLFTHQEFRGIKLDSGPYSESGDVYLKSYPLCFNGHIHTFSKNDNLINVGTPYNKDFGDTLASKAVIIINWEEKIEFERVALRIREKRTMRVNFEELNQIDLPEEHYTRLTIYGNASIILDSPEYKKILKMKNVQVVIEDNKPTSVSHVPKKKIEFFTSLAKKIKKRGLEETFQKIITTKEYDSV